VEAALILAEGQADMKLICAFRNYANTYNNNNNNNNNNSNIVTVACSKVLVFHD
jgi:hypothetical protein